MQAAVYRGVGEVCLEAVPVPSIGPGEALVRIGACGVCGTDIKKMQHGLQPPPRIFGHEMAGTIVALGAGVSGWRVGERVALYHHLPCGACHYCAHEAFAQCPTYKRTGTTAGFTPAGGGFAEYVRVMDWIVAGGGMVRLPDDLTFEEATFLEPVNTCLKGVRRLGIHPGDTVLVCGQGAIGLLLTQLARRDGATVLATDPIPRRREIARALGATAALDPGTDAFTEVIREHTDGRGADAAIVAAGGAGVITQALAAVRPGGKVLLFANTRPGEPVTVDAGAICAAEKDLIGSYSSAVTLNAEVEQIVFRREIDVRSLVTHRYPLAQTAEAIARAASPSGEALKVLVLPTA
ncbi:MAG: alcohol dehydrogenase catalytic domain-containing protein [Armatimonadetes bacterium]|nr:alcohol dehydrogenase catalytic domain-containing protein [Armatimonadota bacterium]